jgi:hypothetical protein
MNIDVNTVLRQSKVSQVSSEMAVKNMFVENADMLILLSKCRGSSAVAVSQFAK